MGRPRLYSEEQYRERRREQDRLRRQATGFVHVALLEEPPLLVPPEVKEKQQRRIAFVERALRSGRITPNQFWLADPVKNRSVSSSLSATEIVALLG